MVISVVVMRTVIYFFQMAVSVVSVVILLGVFFGVS